MSVESYPSFKEFFAALYEGKAPFPWQEEIASRFADGRSPDVVDIPTSAGKTSIADAHLWAAAVNPEHPRRLFVVIDRRVLVGDAYDHARDVIAKLEAAEDGPLAAIRSQLATRSANLVGDDRFAAAYALRGGEGFLVDWLRRVDLPAVIATTVEQIGSTALHRGFLLGRRSRPIGAAMLADSLILVDEAHLAEPLIETLRGLKRVWGGDSGLTWGRPPQVIAATATHSAGGNGAVDVLGLSATDWGVDVLKRRLSTPKWVDVVKAGTDKGSFLAQRAREYMTTLNGDGSSRVPCVLVVANTVETAVNVGHRLEKVPEVDTVRVTGRQRPIDRRRALELLVPFLGGGEEKKAKKRRDARPLFVVATQAIECGLDLDADALVSEAAPWPNIVQRLGRVNRFGELDEAHASIVCSSSEDSVYGHAGARCADVLRALAGPNGTNLCPEEAGKLASRVGLTQEDRAALASPVPAGFVVPLITRLLVETWATNLPGEACQEVMPYLRGLPSRPDTDVYVVWRDVLRETGSGDNTWWADVAKLSQPNVTELCPVAISAAKAWLGQEDGRKRKPYVSVRRGRIEVTSANLKPHDVIVVPSTYGGSDRWGWAGPTNDLAEDVSGVTVSPGGPFGESAVVIGEAIEGFTGEVVGDDGVAIQMITVKPPTEASQLVQTEDDEEDQYAPLIPDLEAHQQDCGQRALSIGCAIGLPDPELEAAMEAAFCHDPGKADPRFQVYLGATPGGPLVAKSGRRFRFVQERRLWEAAGLPSGWRHEAVSLEHLPSDATDLVRWLVGTHHGYGRPIWPVCHGQGVGAVQRAFDGEWVELHTKLVRKYGPWRLALLEAVVRTADWSCSMAPTYTSLATGKAAA